MEEGLGFRVRAVFDITQVEPKREEQRHGKGSDNEEKDKILEEAIAKLPMLPSIPGGQEQLYREAIEHLARQLAWTRASSEAVAPFDHRAIFASLLVQWFCRLEVAWPQGYHQDWQRAFADPKALMHELEGIRFLSAQVILALQEQGKGMSAA